ncbi:hypothetical protein FRC09_012084 [Ceratobasidium sp. 395]|nr:hypothetical protein FRC09_012084 [Ceratobasidium sp. 395]
MAEHEANLSIVHKPRPRETVFFIPSCVAGFQLPAPSSVIPSANCVSRAHPPIGPMNLREKLFHWSEEKAHNEFIGSSLASSRLISDYLRAWVGSSDRGRPFAMKFHSEWMHDGCPAIEWYSQQLESSTKFRSIEHRRCLEGPFYHEFLLLKLTDKAVCKLERIGDGSRADAIRDIGCTSHDYIQWFSEADYDSSSIKLLSKRIVEVDLGREFDILDVLAICYSIQKTRACRAYTLQRYNCYFLCLTVLVVLTRRVASWETKIKAGEWDSIMTVMYERWSNLSPDQAKQHEILAICAYLEPDNPRRAQFIFEILRKHLGSRAEGFTQYNKAMSMALWRADWESVLRAGLLKSLEVVPDLFEDTGYCSQQLKRAVETSEQDAKKGIVSSEILLAKDYFKITAEEEARGHDRAYKLCKNLQRLWHTEHPVSSGKLALSRMVGGLASTVLVLRPASMFADSDYDRRLYSQISTRLAMRKLGSSIITSLVLDSLERSDAMETLWDRADATIENEGGGSMGVRVLDRLASTGVLPPSEVLLLLGKWLDDKNSFAALLASLAASGLNGIVSSLMKSGQTEIRLIPGKLESAHTGLAIEEFQETYIKRRIAAHAKRVSLHQLAAEKSVIEDMGEAMREVWKGLPLECGAVESAPPCEAEESTRNI